MLSVRDTILHHIGASGPCTTDSIVAYLDEQCTDPEWDGVVNNPEKTPPRFQQSVKRATVRRHMVALVGEGKAKVYANDPVDRASEILHSLAYCTGSTEWFQHWTRRIRYTEGVKQMAELCQAYWLIDIVASYQMPRHRLAERTGGFPLWTFKRVPDPNVPGRFGGVVECREDTDSPALVSQAMEYTDFPLPDMKLYVEGSDGDLCLLLPSEH